MRIVTTGGPFVRLVNTVNLKARLGVGSQKHQKVGEYPLTRLEYIILPRLTSCTIQLVIYSGVKEKKNESDYVVFSCPCVETNKLFNETHEPGFCILEFSVSL